MIQPLIKTEAICLDIRPWSRTSHVVSWLTPTGRIVTVVKGAVRPKSAFLGQYDLNYKCEIVYYSRAKGELHALREAVPLNCRDGLRENFRALALGGYFRRLLAEISTTGQEATQLYYLLDEALDTLERTIEPTTELLIAHLLDFELKVLDLIGLKPSISPEGCELSLRGERKLIISPAAARCLNSPLREDDMKILLDSIKLIGVFYAFHVDCAAEIRRMVLGIISKPKPKKVNKTT